MGVRGWGLMHVNRRWRLTKLFLGPRKIKTSKNATLESSMWSQRPCVNHQLSERRRSPDHHLHVSQSGAQEQRFSFRKREKSVLGLWVG